MNAAVISAGQPFRCFLRFPQEGQEVEKLKDGLAHPAQLLAEAREYWQNWKPFDGKVSLKFPGPHGDFLVACARNIQQAREVKGGKLTFQVGPTVYRGLWVVDGNFLLEAARYLGYDAAAQEGLEATWQHQRGEWRRVRGRRGRDVERHRHRHVHPGAAGRAQPGLELFPLHAAERGARREVPRRPSGMKPRPMAASMAAMDCWRRVWATAGWEALIPNSPTPSGPWQD